MLVYEHGNRSGAKGVILSQPLGPTDPRFEPTAAPGGLPALSHFLGGPVGMPGLGHILRVPSYWTGRSGSTFRQTQCNAINSLGCSISCLLRMLLQRQAALAEQLAFAEAAEATGGTHRAMTATQGSSSPLCVACLTGTPVCRQVRAHCRR